DETGEQDHYTFTLATPQRLLMDVLLPSNSTDGSQTRWTLTGPRGDEVTNRTFSASDAANFGFTNSVLDLPAGSYTLTVDGVGDQVGPSSFRLLNLSSGTAFAPGTPQTGTLTNGGRETDLYQFTTAAPNQMFFFDVQAIGNVTSQVDWRVIGPFGE